MGIEYPKYISLSSAIDRFSFENGNRIPEVLPTGEPNTITFKDAKAILRSLPLAKVKPEICGTWINEGPYKTGNGELKKLQQCPICCAVYVSSGTEPWANHPYCAECGARLYPEESR